MCLNQRCRDVTDIGEPDCGGCSNNGVSLRQPINPLMGAGSYSTTSINMKLVLWSLMGGLLHLVKRGGDWVGPQPPRPLLAVPNVTALPSMASVPIIVLLYNGPVLGGFNLPFEGFNS